MPKKPYIFLIIPLFLLILTEPPHARFIIWQVGDLDDSSKGFVPVSNDVITYQVPQDWQVRLGQDDPNWEGFPLALYAIEDNENSPHEIALTFSYTSDYYNPVLVIRASVSNPPQYIQKYLEVFKGEIFIGEKSIVGLPFYAYRFPLGYLKKGISEKNRITIRNRGGSDSPLIFDTIYLYFEDTDTDGDGVTDADEGDCSLEGDVACIPLISYDPKVIKRISLSIEKSKDNGLSFRDVRFVDQNSVRIPGSPVSNRYLPYGLLGFSIEEIAPMGSIGLLISYSDPFYPSLKIYTYQFTGQWDEMVCEFIDVNTIAVILNDGGKVDLYKEKDSKIETILALSYPLSLDGDVEKRGCFIHATIKEK